MSLADDAELAQIEAVARQEWKEAGYFPDAFDMDAYNEMFLAKEMKDQAREWRLNDISQISNLAEKTAIIEAAKDRRLTAEKIKNGAISFAQDRAADVLNQGLDLVGVFEPGFMRRARQRRRNLDLIERSEADAKRVVMERSEAQGRRKQWTKLQIQAKKERDERVAHAAPTAKITKEVEGVAAAEKAQNEVQAFRERSLAIIEQKNNDAVRRAEALEEAKAKQLAALRNWRAGHWSKTSVMALEEAEAMIEEENYNRMRKEREHVAFDDAELAERDMHRTHDQVAGPSISDDPAGLGVFGVPFEQGLPVNHPRNRKPGVDDHQVNLWTSTAQTGYEEDMLEHHQLEAEAMRQSDLYASLQAEVTAVDKEMANLGLLRHRSTHEAKQLAEEARLLEQTMYGPPRREPAPHQIEANHARKKRAKELGERLKQIDDRCQVLKETKGAASGQLTEVAKKVAVARQAMEESELKLSQANEGRGELPVVLGRNISKVDGIGGSLKAKPSESYDMIRHELIFREIEDQVKQAQKVHKGSLMSGTKQWGMEQHRINDEAMVEITMNRLAGLGDRVKVARDKEITSAVVGAVDLFHIKKAKLKEVDLVCEGPINWWGLRTHPKKSALELEGEGDEPEGGSEGKDGETKQTNDNVSHENKSTGNNSRNSEKGSNEKGTEEGAGESVGVVSEEVVTVIQWPSNDMLADEFLKAHPDVKAATEKKLAEARLASKESESVRSGHSVGNASFDQQSKDRPGSGRESLGSELDDDFHSTLSSGSAMAQRLNSGTSSVSFMKHPVPFNELEADSDASFNSNSNSFSNSNSNPNSFSNPNSNSFSNSNPNSFSNASVPFNPNMNASSPSFSNQDDPSATASEPFRSSMTGSSNPPPRRRRGGIDTGSLHSAILQADSLGDVERVAPRHAGRIASATVSQSKMDDQQSVMSLILGPQSENNDALEAAKQLAAEALAESKRLQAEKLALLLKMPKNKKSMDGKWQGVTLRGDVLSGSISGYMQLPRQDYFEISVVITKTRPLELDQGHKDDSVTVRMGPDMKKLVKVAVVKNEPNLEGQYRHVVKYRIRGDGFAYRFDWACQSMDPMLEKRLSIERGFFELYHMEDLEIVIPPKESESQEVRCVSSLVKRMRLMSSASEAKGLGELIKAEENATKSKHFDSDWIHNYPQRYPKRKKFVKLIRNEIIHRAKLKVARQEKEEAELKALIEAEGADNVTLTSSAPPRATNARLEASRKAYTLRKRSLYQTEVDTAGALVGKRIEILEGRAWQRSVVSAVKIDWVQDGLVPKATHKIVPVNEKEKKNGPASWEDLSRRRWYERVEVKVKEVDEEAAARWKANEVRRAEIEKEKEEDALKEKLKLERREEWANGLRSDEEARRQESLEKSRALFEKFNRKAAKSSLGKGAINLKMLRVIGDYRIGLGTSTGLPQVIKKREAHKIATNEWVEEQVMAELDPIEREWDKRQEKLAEFIEDQREAWEDADAANADRLKRVEYKRSMELRVIRENKTKDLRKRLVIPNFEQLIPHATTFSCEHLRCRSWGDAYGKGVRCLDCGTEMSRSHESAKQQAGIGSGDNPALVDQVTRHRRNEASYRFRTGAEFKAVLNERLRLEKDRREVEEIDPLFYDFVDPEYIYDLDRRHRIELKGRNVVRQGVQWRPEEMEQTLEELKEELDAITDPSLRAARDEEVNAWFDEQNPPTFRRSDLKHLAQFRQMIQTHGRISNFRMRIGELEHTIETLKKDAAGCIGVLEFLHRSILGLERDLNSIEADLNQVAMVVQLGVTAQKQLRESREVTMLAALELRDKEMALVGAVEDAEEAEANSLALSKTVREVIRRRVVAERLLSGLLRRVSITRRRANAMLPSRSDAAREVHSMHYRQNGVMVPTPYGYCKVLFYREADDMLLCQLPFGSPRARLYLPLAVPMQLEKAKEDAERLSMERDEEQLRAVYKWEKQMRRDEYLQMNKEERELREHFRRVDEAAAEDKAIAAAIVQGVKDAQNFLLMSDGKHMLHSRGEKLLKGQMNSRTREIKAWKGVGKIPKQMTKWEQRSFVLSTFPDESEKFVAEQKALAELEAKSVVHARHRRHLEDTTVAFIFDLFVSEMLVEVCTGELSLDIEAKRRLENDTGLHFQDPKNMPFAVYSTLSRWWTEEKLWLRSNLEKWGAATVQDRLRVASDADKAAARKKKLEGSLKKMKEQERQSIECEAMWLAEKEVRKVYRAQLRACLSERRAMKNEESETRKYLKELALIQEAKEKDKYTIEGLEGSGSVGMSDKEKRRLEVKQYNITKQRLKKERELMGEQDQLSLAMRVEELKQEQLKILREQMGLVEGSDLVVEKAKANEADMDPEQREQIKKEREERKRKAEEAHMKHEEEARKAFEIVRRAAHVKQAKVELSWMEIEEEARRGESELEYHTASLRRIHLIAQQKGQEELRAKAIARQKRKEADKHVANLEHAQKWHQACELQADKCRRTNDRVQRDTKYMDTTAIAACPGFFYQRLTAVKLHHLLSKLYFTKLLLTITNRAELLATERKLNEISSSMQHANRQLKSKRLAVAALWGDLRRNELLRIKRSDLGTRMFKGWQKNIISGAFRGWVQFWMWQQGVRSAFELDYAVLKHQLDMKRMKPTIQEANERKANTVTEDYTTMSLSGKVPEGIKKRKPVIPKTLHQRHVARPVKCRHCSVFFLEGQNHATACAYHPGEYKAACPQWCPGLTPKCAAHRSKRWTCCDVRELGKFGSTGCRQRFHMGVESDPSYASAVAEKEKYFSEAIAEAEAKMQVITQQDMKDLARKVKMEQLGEIAETVEKDRAIAKRADLFNFSQTLLDTYKEEAKQMK